MGNGGIIMKKAILGKKLGMTQIFTETGAFIPVTVIEAGPCTVLQVKTLEKDGYEALKVGFSDAKEKNTNSPDMGQFKAADVSPKRLIKELKLEGDYKVGSVINCEIFAKGDIVDVQGTTRGRGFTGVIQRWNQHRLKMTHGVGPVHRQVGSMGANSTPSRVLPGKNMPGHYGVETVTIQNLEIVEIDAAKNVLLVRGSVPGPKGAYVVVKQAIKKTK